METEKADVAVTSRPETLIQVVGEAEEKKAVYMFLLHVDGPNIHTLYAVEILPEILLPLDDDDRFRCPVKKTGPEPLSPILDFPRKKYPWSLCCVQLDSKLYFLGGELKERDGHIRPMYPPDVHVFDPAATETTKLLGEAPKMSTGKVSPMAFVVERRIFVVSGFQYNKTGENLSRFEVFDPDARSGSGEWTQFPDPPFCCRLTGHATVHRKVFILTGDEELYSLDVDSYQWCKVAQDITISYQGGAELVEDTYYACTYMQVSSFRPCVITSSSSSSPRVNLLDDLAHVWPGVIWPDFPTLRSFPSASLTHMGKKRFCYVMIANALMPHPSDANDRVVEDPKRCFLSLTMFEAFKDTHRMEYDTHFKAKFLRSALFIINPSSSVNFVTHSFTLPSLGVRRAIEHLSFGIGEPAV